MINSCLLNIIRTREVGAERSFGKRLPTSEEIKPRSPMSELSWTSHISGFTAATAVRGEPGHRRATAF